MKERKTKVRRRIGNILFVFLITALFTCGVVGAFALYKMKRSGTATIKVAKWEVSAEFIGETNNFTLSEGEATAFYSFSITSKSEVAVAYDVTLTLPSALPDGVFFTINDVEPTIDGLRYTFSNVGRITAGGGTNIHVLKIAATDFSVGWSLNDITVTVNVAQVQPN